MPALRNQRHERFAIEISEGLSQSEAYKRAGYKEDRGHSSRLAANGNVQARIAELQAKTAEKILEKTAMDRAWVLEELRANFERHKETYGAVANRALELTRKGRRGWWDDQVAGCAATLTTSISAVSLLPLVSGPSSTEITTRTRKNT